jgi:signal transduction histidine kinase
VRVCSQKAKQYYDSTDKVYEILKDEGMKAAILAPSFPAEFLDLDPAQLVAMIRKLGFRLVCEVAFGADIVAAAYQRLLRQKLNQRHIATTCPAIVAFIEKYHTNLLEHLVPIASPMVATARALRRIHGDGLKVVFVGPCIAKKAEAARNGEPRDINAVLTFAELRGMFKEVGVVPDPAASGDFDPPHPNLGTLFPLSGGMLHAARMREDPLNSQVVSADGRPHFAEAVIEFESGVLTPQLLELLCCRGCISGSGFSNDVPFFARRNAVSSYVRNRISDPRRLPDVEMIEEMSRTLDLAVSFSQDDHRLPQPSPEQITRILNAMGKYKPEDELNCHACGYATCREHAIAIEMGLAEDEMCLPYTIERLRKSLEELNLSNEQLNETRQALIDAEKLASMGQLSAGIAHEINNPLGVILLNSRLLLQQSHPGEEGYEDLVLIVEQAERCRKIVAGLLNFARKNKVILQPTNLQNLIRRCLKAIVSKNNVTIEVDLAMQDPIADLDKDQISQVLTNLIVNSMEAMPSGGQIRIVARDETDTVQFSVQDSGHGIAPEHLNKIFEPLFTTKQMGKGTGLGLSVTYGIIKMHRGQINAQSNADPQKGPTGTTFTVTLPRRAKE